MRGRVGGAAVAAAVVCVTGCTAPVESPQPAPDAEPTTLASYDVEGARVVRGPFCDRVSPTGIEHALGDAPEASQSWGNGDRVRLPDGSRDRVHEFGCTWTAGDGTQASAWVFVPPVTEQRARSLARSAGGGCPSSRGTSFGAPSVRVRCTEDGVTEESYRGLVGDAWLTCALATPDAPADIRERASAWCVSVLEATRAG